MAKPGKDLPKDATKDVAPKDLTPKDLTPDLTALDPERAQTGLLADEEAGDRRMPWRLASWGVGAVGAVTIAVIANQSYVHSRQDRAAIIDLTRRSEQIQMIARESRNDIRRLAAAVDTLNGDRDRLFARATALEQGLESASDRIARQTAAFAAFKALPPDQKPPPSSGTAADEPARPAPEAKSEPVEAAPDITASIAAAAPPASAVEVTVPRTAFAVDLGAANSIDGLRALWRRLTATHHAALANLQPAIALRERKAPRTCNCA